MLYIPGFFHDRIWNLIFGLFLVVLLCSNRYGYSQFTEDFITHPKIIRADSLFYFYDDYDGSEYLFNKAISELTQDEWENKVYCYLKLSNLFTSLNKYDIALSYLTKAKTILFSNISDNENEKIVSEYYSYEGKYLRKTGKIDSALFSLTKSIELKRKCFGEISFSLTESLYFLADLYHYDLNLYLRAEDIYRQIIKIYGSIFEKENQIHGRLYSTLASCFRKQYDYANAIEYGKRSVQLLKSDSLYNINRFTTAIIILANTYTEYGDYKNSIPNYQKVLKYVEYSDDPKFYTWFAYNGLAYAYMNKNNYDEARYYLDQNLGFIQSVNYGQDYLAFQYILYANYFIKINDYKNSKDYLMKALNYYENTSNPYIPDATLCYKIAGNFYNSNNNYDSALFYYQKAIITLIDGFSDTEIYSNPEEVNITNQAELYDLFYLKAASLRKKYDQQKEIKYLKAALNNYKLIDNMNDRSRSSKLKDASLLIIHQYYKKEYEKAIETTYELHKITQNPGYIDTAFHFMEKSKYMLILKGLIMAEKSRNLNLPYSIKYREDSLRIKNEEFTNLLNLENSKENPDNSKILSLQEKVFQTEKALDDLRIQIADQYPEYYEIRYDSVFKDFKNFSTFCLKQKNIGIEYFWGDRYIYQIVTDGVSHQFNRVLNSDTIRASISNMLHSLASGLDYSNMDVSYQDYIRDAWSIYRVLLHNIYEESSYDTGTDLLIIPDGVLSQLPFEALLYEPGDPTYTDYSTLPYLIRRHSINYTYSANLLLNERNMSEEPGGDLLAFSYSGPDALTDKGLRASSDEIPRTAVELIAINDILEGNNEYYFSDDATEHVFKQKAPEFRVLHLAVHGFADTTSENNARLVFKQSKDTAEDDTLYMYELYGLDLSGSELAVLSACETGIGREFTGEGVFSMARGFAYAGCPSIVMSLWKVNDEFTAELMKDFYRKMKKGRTTKEALRIAKLRFLEGHDEFQAHPANWASFVLLGQHKQLFKSQNNILIISLISLLAIIIGVIIIFKSKSVNK